MRKGKIKNKLIGAFLLLITLMIFLGINSYSRAAKALRENYEDSIRKTMSSKAEYLNLAVTTIERDVIKLLTDATFINYYTGTATTAVEEEEMHKNTYKNCAKVATSNDFIYSFNVMANQGKPYASKGTLTAKAYTDYLQSKEGQALEASDELYKWSGYHEFIDTTTHNTSEGYVMSLMYKFIKGDGVAIVDIDAKKIIEALAELDFGEGSLVGFITPDGRETLVGHTALGQFGDMIQSAEVNLDRASQNYTYIDYQGNNYLLSYIPIGSMGASLCALVPRDSIIKDAEAIRMGTVLMVIIACLIALIIGTWIAGGIEKVIANMQSTLDRAAAGDLTGNIITTRQDEFGRLLQSMARMFKQIKKLIQQTAEVGEDMICSSEEVKAVSHTLLEASNDIHDAIRGIEAGIMIQAEDTSKCLDQMDNLATKLNGLYRSTQAMEAFTTQALQSTDKGVVVIGNLKEKSKETREATHQVTRDVEMLAATLNQIESIINMMNSIAEQTNLLALNASIEAARAGESGRGFAVVAKEVGKLAEQSGSGAKKIELLIEQIQQQTKGTVQAIQKTREISDAQGDALQVTVQVFQEIQQDITTLSHNIEGISGDIKDIERAKEDTLNAVNNISAIAQETASTSEGVSHTAHQQLEVAHQLSDASGALAQNATKLSAAIAQFKI